MPAGNKPLHLSERTEVHDASWCHWATVSSYKILFNINVWGKISMGYCYKDVTPLLTHWSYVSLALIHRNGLFIYNHRLPRDEYFYSIVLETKTWIVQIDLPNVFTDQWQMVTLSISFKIIIPPLSSEEVAGRYRKLKNCFQIKWYRFHYECKGLSTFFSA